MGLEHLMDAMPERRSRDIDPMTLRCGIAEHGSGTIKVGMGYPRPLTRTLKNMRTELPELPANSMKRVVSSLGIGRLMQGTPV